MARRYPFLHFQPGVDWKDVNKDLLARLNQLGRDLKTVVTVTSGFRTYEQQAALYAKYKAGGNIAARPGRSFHEHGGALDATIGGKAIANVVGKTTLARHGLAAPVPGDPVHIQLSGAKASAPSQAPTPATDSSAPVPHDTVAPEGPSSPVTPPLAVPPPTALGVTASGPEMPGSQNYTLDPRQVSETWSSLAADPFASDETKQWAQRAMLASGG